MRIVAATFGLVAIAVVTLGWLQSPDRLTAAEAGTVAAHAYEVAGLAGAVVEPTPEAGVYEAPAGDARIPVWKTVAAVDGGTIQLWLSRADGESVFLDDRSADGTTQLLTDDQFSRLAAHYENPTVTRQIHRNLLLTLAAGLIVLLAVRLSVVRLSVDVRQLARSSAREAGPRAKFDALLSGVAPASAANAELETRVEQVADRDAAPAIADDDDDDDDDDEDEDVDEDGAEDEDEAEEEADDWEPMWDDPVDTVGRTREGEWEPMWDDNPRGGSVADDDAWDEASEPAAEPPSQWGTGRSRLQATEQRQLHASGD